MSKKTRKQRRKLRIIPIYAIVEKVKSAYEILIYETASGNEPFNDWLDSLDNSVKGKVIARVDRLKKGLFGNAKALKDGLYELKFKNLPSAFIMRLSASRSFCWCRVEIKISNLKTSKKRKNI